MDPAVVLAQAKKTTGLFNFQGRAAIAEKHMAIKLAAKQRSEKSKNRATTPDHNSSATAHDTSATTKNVSLPSVGRIQNVTCKVKNLTLKLNAAEVSFPKVKEVGPNTAQKNVIPNTKARNARGKIFEGPIATRVTGAQPQKAPVGLHWKSSSGNIVSVDKPMFLTETEEQVSPSKNVFQNTLSKNREKTSTHAIQITAESLIVSASRLCLASHSTSHRTSNFWFNASIALAAISQDTLEPALRYFNRSIAEDINMGHVIAALIKALNDLSDAYQEFLFSWIEEQQELFVNARLRSQTDWFDDSLKLSYSHIEKLCFVANEVIAFLEEPQIPAESKFEQIQHDKKNLEDMLTLSHDFHRAESQVMGSDIQDQIGRMTGKDKALVLEESSIYSAELGEVSLIEDEFEDNEDTMSCEEHVIEINIESKIGGKKASLVVAAARKYLKMKVQMRGNIKTGRKSVLPSIPSSATAIPASRVAYLHTCKALGVAPLPELFLSESFEEIDLRHYMLGLRGSIALSAGCCKFLDLKRLDLQHCMITVAGILLMSEAVANCSKLEYVNVGSCIPTSESGNCEEMGLAIINFTHSSKALHVTELVLSNNSIIGIPIISWDSVQTGVNEHLSKLDLGQCNLGSAACIPLSRAIQKLVKLTSLNLRWNNFNGDAICKLLDVLAFHRHLLELDMSRNSCINNKSSVAIQTLLFNNMSLSSLNLSFCNIKPTHATIISAGYMSNQSLRKLYVEGNPLGPQGAVALFKISSSEYNEDARLMSLAGCNLDFNEADVDLFDFLHPSCENKAFRLVEEYDWACAFLLCAKRCECAQEIFKKANLDGISWNIPGVIFDETMFPHESDTPEAMKEKLRFRTKQVTEQRRLVFANLPKTGVLTLSIEYSNPPNIMSDVIFANNIVIMSQTSLGDGGLMSKKFVKLAMHSMPEALLTSSQAKEILAKIDDESSKAEFIGNMIEKIVDKANFVPEIDKLPKDIAKKLKVDLKEILAFNSNNASGRYSFDLERFADQMILKKLMEVNNREKVFRQQLRSGNTSCFSDWENFRNFTLNGHDMRFTAAWKPPEKGKVSCDYTCIIRPPKGSKPMDQKCLERWIEGLSRFVSVRYYRREDQIVIPEVSEEHTSQNLEIIFEGVSWLSNNFYISCVQLERVLHAFLMAGPLIMTHVVQRLFSRVLDLGKFREVLLKYFSPENYVLVMNRIGWLNASNSFEVDGFYKLDLAVPEQREVAIFLVDLAVQEPGENWQDEEYDGKPFELPKSWTIEVPYKHLLSMKYYTGPNCSLQHLRKKWSRKFLFDSSTTEEYWETTSDENDPDGWGIEYSFGLKVYADQTSEDAVLVAPTAHSNSQVQEEKIVDRSESAGPNLRGEPQESTMAQPEQRDENHVDVDKIPDVNTSDHNDVEHS